MSLRLKLLLFYKSDLCHKSIPNTETSETRSNVFSLICSSSPSSTPLRFLFLTSCSSLSPVCC